MGSDITYPEIIKAARASAGIGGVMPMEALNEALDRDGRVPFSVISRKIIRDRQGREDCITALVRSGAARVEAVVTDGRPGLWLVVIR